MVCVRSILLSSLLAAVAVGQTISATLQNITDTDTFASYVDKFPNLSTALEAQNITLLLPLDSAFDGVATSNITEALLTYHILVGSYENFTTDQPQYIETALRTTDGRAPVVNQMVIAQGNDDSSTVEFMSGQGRYSLTYGNMTSCDNGVIYTISSLLTVPENFSSSYDNSMLSGPSPFTDFKVNTANGTKQSLDNLTDVTVFLPISYSFNQIGSLVNIWSKDFLEGILTYHVVNELYYLDAPPANPINLTSLDGKTLTLSTYGGDAYVNNAKIVADPAFLFNGGIAYSIYGVLNPENTTITPAKSPLGMAYTNGAYTKNVVYGKGGGLSIGAEAAIIAAMLALALLGATIGSIFCFRRRKMSDHGEITEGAIYENGVYQQKQMRSNFIELQSRDEKSIWSMKK